MESASAQLPVYQQLNARLRDVLAREYHSGDQFLTERDVAERFQVSRATANKSLASLVSEGWLEFRKGLGTFVRRQAIDYDVRSLVSFTEKARAAGQSPSTELIAFDKLTAAACEDGVRAALNVGESEPLWSILRVRCADGQPVILEQRYVVRRLCPRLTRSQVSGSLYRAWTETHRLQIGGAREVIRAVLLDRAEAERLQVPVGSPALQVVSVGFLGDETPLWWERTLYRADRYEFHSQLGPIQSATPAQGRLRS